VCKCVVLGTRLKLFNCRSFLPKVTKMSYEQNPVPFSPSRLQMIRDICSFMPAVYLAVLSPYRVSVNKQLAFYDKLLADIREAGRRPSQMIFIERIQVMSGRQKSMFITMAITCPLNIHKR